jgi:hypothetical protein
MQLAQGKPSYGVGATGHIHRLDISTEVGDFVSLAIATGHGAGYGRNILAQDDCSFGTYKCAIVVGGP